jgi:hypothetical protein
MVFPAIEFPVVFNVITAFVPFEPVAPVAP